MGLLVQEINILCGNHLQGSVVVILIVVTVFLSSVFPLQGFELVEYSSEC